MFNVKDFGAIGNGIADDTLAIQKAVSKALSVRGQVFIPNGKYRITATINCIPVLGQDTGTTLDPNGGKLDRSGCSICGEHRTGTIIWADFDNWKINNVGNSGACQYYLPNGNLAILRETKGDNSNVAITDKIVFLSGEYTNFSDMWIIKKTNNNTPSGIAFSTAFDTYAANATFERLNVDLFSYGFWFRFSSNVNFKDIIINKCIVGMRFARVDNRYPNNNPFASNIGEWTHQMLNFYNVCIEGGASSSGPTKAGVTEVGIWGSIENSSFNFCEFNNIFRGNAAAKNTILPVGNQGTGIYLESATLTSKANFVNIEFYKSSSIERAIYCTDRKYIELHALLLGGMIPVAISGVTIPNNKVALEFNNCAGVNIVGEIQFWGSFDVQLIANYKSSVYYDRILYSKDSVSALMKGAMIKDSTSAIYEKQIPFI